MLKPDQIPNAITTPTTEYPYGNLKDDTIEGAGDGSPIRRDYIQDLWSAHLEVVDRAGAVPDGTPETATSSQFADAIEGIIDDKIDANLIDNAHMADMPTMTIKGNDAVTSADPQDLTVSEVQTMLNLPANTNTSFTDVNTNLDILNDFRAWDATRDYDTNEPCFQNGQPYRSLITSNTGNDPEANPDKWELVGGGGAGGGKNFLKNPLTENNITEWTRSAGTALSWSTATPLVGGGALLIDTLTTGQTVDGALDDVNPVDGGQAWAIGLGYYIDTGATYVDGDLQVVLYDGATEIQGGNLPIVLGQVSTTKVFVYPSATLTGLKVRIKCNAGTGTLRIGDVAVAPQQILTMPAISDWMPKVWDTKITNLPGDWDSTKTKWRRVGTTFEGQFVYNVTGAGTGNISVTLSTLLAELGLSSGSQPIDFMATMRPGTTAHIQGTYRLGNDFRTPTGGQWSATVPATWANTHWLEFAIAVQINEWSNSIQVSGEEVEYTYNSSLTTTNDTTSFGYGIDGVAMQAFAPTTTNYVQKRIRFKTPIKPSDTLDVEIYRGGSWISMPAVCPFNISDTGGVIHGVLFIPVNETDVDVRFYSKADYYTAWITAWRWRVVKRSGGSMAEVPPVVRAEYTGTMTATPTGSVAINNIANKVEDTHSAVQNPTTDWAFRVPVEGIYRMDITFGASVASSTNAVFNTFFTKNGGGTTRIGRCGVSAGLGGADVNGSWSSRFAVGDLIRFTVSAVGNTSGNFNSQIVVITRLGS